MTDVRPLAARIGSLATGWFGPLLALAMVITLFGVVDVVLSGGQSTFLTVRNFRTVTVQTCVVAVAALGMTTIIIAGGIDLSAGAALALAATLLAWSLREDVATICRFGTNLPRAARQLDDAVKKSVDAQRAGEADESARWSQVAQRQRHAIRAIIARKRQTLATGLPPPAPFVAALDTLEAQLSQTAQPFAPVVGSARIPNDPWTAALAVLICCVTGATAGLFNGLAISGLRVVPFIITLGTMTVFVGLGNLISDNIPIRPAPHTVPRAVTSLVSNTPDDFVLGFPLGVWLTLILALGLASILRYTVFGRHVFALGSNEATARLCGINVTFVKIAVYASGGLFFGLAGLCQFARLSTGDPMSGLGLELKVIAAVVIGGASLSGGRGSVIGTLAGALIMQAISSGCTQIGLPDPIERIVTGLVIIGAVTLDQVRHRRLNRE
jgi:ribose transport system permease protein